MSNKNFKVRPRSKYNRKFQDRGKLKERILIVCEGEKTEPNYFRGFKVSSSQIVKIDIKGSGKDTCRIVEEALRLKKIAEKNKEAYNQVWCVFDRNSFPMEDFNHALFLARQNNIKVAYSNEAFELWYLLHFHFFNTGISRDQYKEKLSKFLGYEYKKNSRTMYDELSGEQQNAIKNEKKLLSQYNYPNPAKDNPSTTVHLLVEELNKWK